MSTSTPVTEAHRELAYAILFATEDGHAGPNETAQLIADSEAKAVEPWRTQVEELRGALALGQENCDDVFDDLQEERDQLRADKIRLDALDAILAENAHRARLGWRWNPEGPDSEFKLHLSQDGKMRSIRQALDVMLAARKEGAK
jgi:hypothetical protein